jgi:hypothetical protein
MNPNRHSDEYKRQQKLADIKKQALALQSELNKKVAQEKKTKTKQEKVKDLKGSNTSVKNLKQSPQERASSLQNFSSALQDAIGMAREKRQNKDLDFLQGKIPKGAVTAGQFTGLLANLNQASESFARPLASEAIEFARMDQEQVIKEQEFQREQQEKQRQDIRDLALTVVENGGSNEIVNGILNSKDLDSAIGMAAGALNTKSKMNVEKVNDQLVTYDPADPEGTLKVIFNGKTSSSKGSTTSGSSSTPSGGVDISDGFDFMKKTMGDVKIEARKMFAPEVANQIINTLTDEQLRLFMTDYINEVNTKQMSINPLSFLASWSGESGLSVKEEDTSTVQNRFRK